MRKTWGRALVSKLFRSKAAGLQQPLQDVQTAAKAQASSANISRHKVEPGTKRTAWLFPSFVLTQPTEPATPTVQPETAAPDTDPLFNYEHALRACARGDRAALQSLYKQEGRHLLGVAMRIVRQRQQAEDVVHDAFISIWTKAGSFDAQLGSGRGWIYSVVRNLSFNAVRNGSREVSVDEETAEALDARASMAAHPQMAEAFEMRASVGKLNDCLSQLEPARRNCILYAYVDGCSHGEIAERTKTPLGTVKAWIKRGMGALRECMA